MKKIAVFDLDDTIVSINTTFRFIDFYLRRTSRLRYIIFIIARELSFVIDYRKIAIKLLRGSSKDELESAANGFYSSSQKYINIELLEVIERVKGEGCKLILVSGTLDCIAETFAENLGFDYWRSSVLSYQDGKCLGTLSSDMLDHKQELVNIDPVFENVDFSKSYCLSDNKTDLKLLSLFGNSLAIVHDSSWDRKTEEDYWHKNGVKTMRISSLSEFRMSLAFIPLSYAVYTKRVPPSAKNVAIWTYFIPQLVNLLLLGVGISLWSLVVFLLALMASLSIYEIGYAMNDCLAFTEKSPTLRTTQKFCKDLNMFVAAKLATFIFITVALFFMSADVPLFILVNLSMFLVFSIHNFLPEASKAKIITFPILRILKLVAPLACLSGNFILGGLFYVVYMLIPDVVPYWNKKIAGRGYDHIDHRRQSTAFHAALAAVFMVLFVVGHSQIALYIGIIGVYLSAFDVAKLNSGDGR